jgi:GDPmannose 4,6-dehydratase
MWLMLQRDEPDDYVVATGESHSVREFCELAFGHVGLDYRSHIRIDPAYYRPTEVDSLCGDVSKAAGLLGWRPTVSFEELVGLMVDAELEREGLPAAAAPGRMLGTPETLESSLT